MGPESPIWAPGVPLTIVCEVRADEVGCVSLLVDGAEAARAHITIFKIIMGKRGAII